MRPPLVKIFQPCIICKLEFLVKPKIRKGKDLTKKTCSLDCKRKLYSQMRVGLPAPNKGRRTVFKQECERCKVIMLFNRNRAERRFCKICIHVVRAELKGEKHWKWNHDRSNVKPKSEKRKEVMRALNRIFYNDDEKVREIVGYTREELHQHLTARFSNGMTLKNRGNGDGKWNIDHIKPISKFSLDAPVSIVNSLNNLQPLWWCENLRKSATY